MKRQSSVLIGDILSECIPPGSAIGKGLLTARIKKAYCDAVGSTAAAATMSVSFDGGTLRCRISSSVLRMHLSSSREEIRKNINAILGSEEVQTLMFT